jgi:hypothetical protein
LFSFLSYASFAQQGENEIARKLLEKNVPSTRLTLVDLQNSVIKESYVIPSTNIRMIYLLQTYNGIPVYNKINVLAFKEDQLASNVGERVSAPEVKSKQATSIPKINASEAVQKTITALQVKNTAAIKVNNGVTTDGKTKFGTMNFALEEVTAELIWLPMEETGELKLAWQVFMAPATDQDYWLVNIDAVNGTFINKQSLTLKCNWDNEVHSIKAHEQHKSNLENSGSHLLNMYKPAEKTYTPLPIVNNALYRVIKYPAESPQHPGGVHTTVSNPWTLSPGNATTLGWHFDNVTYYSSTRGNNVHAYEDVASINAPGITEASTTPQPNLTFNFVPNYAVAPTQRTPNNNQQFNITNLFYWNNLIHDLSYLYGFTESARNFQSDNLGRGGAGNDYVKAEAQDGSGINNANFSTPPDGGSGRMQMYLFNTTTPNRDGDVDNGVIVHEYTHGISNRLTGTGSGCLGNQEQMGEGWSDYFGLMMTQNWATSVVTDGFSSPRGIGTYVLNQPTTGVGVRQYKYCTDMTVNPLVYSNIATVAVPHGVGTIWCTVLWDMTWEIIKIQGINPNLFNIVGGGGNTIALKLVTEGMRLQPCSPGFIDGRNAILKADTLFFGARYSCAILKAFARRGMGVGATQGSSNSRNDQTYSFIGCADLYVKDDPADNGIEPNPLASGAFWASPDIWVCNANNLCAAHTNPLGSNFNTVRVRVTNLGTGTSNGTEKVKLYWAKASTGLGWPNAWLGTAPTVCTSQPTGGFIGTINIPAGIAPSASVVLSLPNWVAPFIYN